MSDFVQWLLIAELIGIVFLPLTAMICRGLPDRGYAFAKILGLLLLTYGVWVVGSAAPVARPVLLTAAVLVAGAALSWWFWRGYALEALRECRRAIVIEEVLFVGGLLAWSLLRAFVFHPAIAHTEQPQDLAFLQASLGSASFPPYDPWMSGHTINYYYLGYLMFATLTKLSGVPAAVGYNLALSTLFAFCLSACYGIGLALIRRTGWALLAPLFVVLLGNWHAILVQLPQHELPGNTTWWFFASTRVIGNPNTINEFPFFSFMLGDLHPHVMALPVTLLILGLGCAILLAPRDRGLVSTSDGRVTLVAMALAAGALFMINSWDFPTYLLLLGACIAAQAYASNPARDWWKPPLVEVAALGILSVVLFLPFYLRFQSLSHGVGVVTTRSNFGEFLQVFGIFLLPVAIFLGSLGGLLQPESEPEDGEYHPATGIRLPSLPDSGSATPVLAGAGAVLAGLVVVAAITGAWVFISVGTLGVFAGVMLYRVLNTAHPNRFDVAALLCVAIGCLVVALPELVYLRDTFDGGATYRMNTVFKFYYQGWTLLGIAGAYGIFRSFDILKGLATRGVALGSVALVALGVLGGGAYPVFALQSSIQDYGDHGLDGAAWIQSQYPGDYAAMRWLDAHSTPGTVELEGISPDYQYGARFATYAHLSTVMGWVGHEIQWRIDDPEVQQRQNDVQTMYESPSLATTKRLLAKYHVRYVVVGGLERAAYGGNGQLGKFGRLMKVVFRADGTVIYSH